MTRSSGNGWGQFPTPVGIEVDGPPGFIIERGITVGGKGVGIPGPPSRAEPPDSKLVKQSEKVVTKALIRFLDEVEAVASVRHLNGCVRAARYDHRGGLSVQL